jgi:hypothetical protein
MKLASVPGSVAAPAAFATTRPIRGSVESTRMVISTLRVPFLGN